MNRQPEIKISHTTPTNSIIENHISKIDYCDSLSLKIQKESYISNDEIINQVFEFPNWIKALFKLRNFLVKPFGLDTEKEIGKPSNFYAVGEKAIFFKVIDRNENEILIGETDSHLKAYLSIMQVEKPTYKIVYITTVVRFSHIGGRLYFIPVKPFHIIIIKNMLKKLHKTLQNEYK